MAAVVRTPFDPARHGLAFANRFPPGTLVVSLTTGFGRIKIGDVSGGLCGGMVFAALDGYFWGVPPPPEPTPPVVRYLARRLIASWGPPFGALTYYRHQCTPQRRLTEGCVASDWPEIRAQLDSGVPVPLGVVQAAGVNPRRLVRHHQVLAHGYREGAGGPSLLIYDPNHPVEHDLTLEFPRDSEGAFRHGCDGDTVRGVFVTPYECPLVPPDWAG